MFQSPMINLRISMMIQMMTSMMMTKTSMAENDAPLLLRQPQDLRKLSGKTRRKELSRPRIRKRQPKSQKKLYKESTRPKEFTNKGRRRPKRLRSIRVRLLSKSKSFVQNSKDMKLNGKQSKENGLPKCQKEIALKKRCPSLRTLLSLRRLNAKALMIFFSKS